MIKLTFKDKQKTLYNRIRSLRKRATPSEVYMDELLKESGIKYIFQKGFINGNGYVIVDFYFPKPYKICLEIDGEYHLTPFQIAKDKWRTNYLNNRGFRVIRISNEECMKMDIEKLKWVLE